MKYIAILCVAAALLGMEACNSSSTPSVPADYFKGIDKLGNYWVYKNQEIDTNGVLQTASYLDSTWVNGVQLIDGKQATQLISHVMQDSAESYDTTFVYRDVNKMYLYTDLGPNPIDTAAPVKKWTLVADLDATAPWLALDTLKFNQEQAVGTFTIIIKMNIFGNVYKRNDTTITAANSIAYKTKVFSLEPTISGTASAKGLPISQNIVSTGGQRRQFYADGLALIAERQEPGVLKVGDGSFFPDQKSPGSLRSLLRYHIQ